MFPRLLARRMDRSCRTQCSATFVLCMSIVFLFVLRIDIVSGVTSSEKASLLSFRMSVFSDPEHALRNWNSSGVHVCEWTGVRCDEARNEVLQLILTERSLRGAISPALGGVSSLRVVDLSKNYFEGSVPAELGSLLQLKELSLAWNLLQGAIPVEFGLLRRLVYVDLGNNRLSGDIPVGFFCNGSSPLQYVDLSNNSFTGEIPLEDECEMKDLRYLLLWSNRLTGGVPTALANSTRLEWLDLESNMLNGELPTDIVSQMPYLQFLYLSHNQFTARGGNTNLEAFFDALSNSSSLQELGLSANDLSGDIPSSIGRLPRNLAQIHLSENQLHGSIPPQISNLLNLTLLNLSSNLLNGTIPTLLCRMGRLERLYLSNNSLSGEIPSALGDLLHLGLLDLSLNTLSGSIPDSFANLSQLRKLLLYWNRLSGTIPPGLGKCVNLEILDLSYNRISGAIPGEVVRLGSLKIFLNLSHNNLGGDLPLELSKMDMVLAVDLSSNNLSGTIPSQIGSCIALEYLNLSGNSLEGPLPISMGLLPYLQTLDVSYNRMIGPIPGTFLASSTLKTLNFSFNDFSGNVLADGTFSNLTVDSFLGNEGLCGSIKGMGACKKRKYYHLIVVPILLSLVITPMFCLCGYPLVSQSKITRRLSVFSQGDAEEDDEPEGQEHKFPKITHGELMEATGGFSQSNLIGSGHFGHVYKGVLQDNTRIAVKVLDSESTVEIPQSFKRECQILSRTRHRNLIRIITTCSKPDFKALVFPLMSKGSLEMYLYPSGGLPRKLDLMQLVSVCSDVAEAVAYLHHHSPVRVIHCDLKPSNVLLDDCMKAIVTDFGIAKLLKVGEESVAATTAMDSISFSSTDRLLCGSVGYIAPEYGMGKSASTQGDVFSFGVLVLEIVTGVRPTDPLFDHWSSLHEWVKSHYPHKLDTIIEQAVDRYCSGSPSAMLEYIPAEHVQRDVLVALIELGLICTQFSPSMRPTMLDVAQEMGRLREYLSRELVDLPYK